MKSLMLVFLGKRVDIVFLEWFSYIQRKTMAVIRTSNSRGQSLAPSFVIDSFPFRPGERLDVAVLDIAEDRVIDWPMVYILANEHSAYVGQTTSIANRMDQHGASAEKRDFTTASVIYHDEFNMSVITDYEHRLIGLLHADGKYRLTNKNKGMTDSNYFSKRQYADMFEALWDELRRLELAVHSIDEIEESEVFRYSPYKGLTPDQRVALDKILAAIDNGFEDAKPIVIEGMPGTGKTILAIYLLKALRDDPRYAKLNLRLVEPVTSLRNTLRKTLQGVNGIGPDDVIGPADLAKLKYGYVEGKEKCFDILLVDEAHRLKQRKNLGTQFGNYDSVNQQLRLPKDSTQMDWILEQAKLPIFFYDPLQVVGPSCLDGQQISQALGDALKDSISLDSQMRVKGGRGYLEFIQAILKGKHPAPRSFDGYSIVLYEDFRDFVESFDRTFMKHSMSRMVAGYAWKWKTKRSSDPDLFDIEIDGIGLRWNCTYDNWVGRGAEDSRIAHEVGCIHSIQGYDLSHAFVLIGDDIVFDPKTGQLKANRSSYFDRNGYATASEEELTQYIKNIYYVLLTRGIYGTHIYVVNPELRRYLRQFLL